MKVQVDRGREAPPVYGPVNLSAMDRAAKQHAMQLLRQSIGFGAEVVGFKQQEPLIRLGEAINEKLFEGAASDGLELNDLTRGRTAAGRIRAAFNGDLRKVVDLAVRSLFFLCDVRPMHEYITSLPFQTGGEMNGLGVDHLPGLGRVAHGLFAGVAASDRVLYTQGSWLLTGTVGDPSSPRFDPEWADRWAMGFDRGLVGPMNESLEMLFKDELSARKAALKAAGKNLAPFQRLGLDPIAFLKHYFPTCVIVDALPYGPPEGHGDSSGGVFYPGDDEATVGVIETAGRYGIARCRLDVAVANFNEVEHSLLPELAERFGEEPELLPPHLLEQVIDWKKAQQAGIGPGVRFIRYWRFKGSGHVVRAAQLSGRDGGQVNDVTVWRSIGLDGSLQREMVALLERAAQSWPWGCITRFREECQPGKVQAWKAAQREGMLKSQLAANAASVSAHRAMEVLRMHALEGR